LTDPVLIVRIPPVEENIMKKAIQNNSYLFFLFILWVLETGFDLRVMKKEG